MPQQADGYQESESPMYTAELSTGQAVVASSGAPPPPLGVPLSESYPALLHDARNLVSAIDLYCDLLEQPGVLNTPFQHYAGELRLVGETSRRLLEKLSLGASQTRLQQTTGSNPARPANPQPVPISQPNPASPSRNRRRQVFQTGEAVACLAEEVQANHNLISALVGPAIQVSLSISGGRCPVPMTSEDLTRVLVNLARNAADAMPAGGRIHIQVEESGDRISISFADNGPGIPEADIEKIFSPGYSTRTGSDSKPGPGPASKISAISSRGLGLSIVRSIISAAGGAVHAVRLIGDPNPEVILSEDGLTCSGSLIRIEFPRGELSATR
jgi:signal transduction histidine kinase